MDSSGDRATDGSALRDAIDHLASLQSVLGKLTVELPDAGPTTSEDAEQARMTAAVELAAALPEEINQRMTALAAARFSGGDRSGTVRVHLTDACTRMTLELDPSAYEADPEELAHRIEDAHASAVDAFRREQSDRQQWLESAVAPVRKLLTAAENRAGLS